MIVRAAGAREWRPVQRWPLLLLTLAVVVELAVGLVGLRTVTDQPAGSDQDPTASATTSEAPTQPREPDYSGGLGADAEQQAKRSAAVRDLLGVRASALLDRDRERFLGTVDPQATAFRDRQATLFDNLANTPLEHWSYRLDSAVEQPVSDPVFARYRAPVWAPEVTLVYALRGVDPIPTERPQHLTFVRRDEHWYLGSDSDFPEHRTWRGLWDFGPVVSYEGESSLVLAHPRHAARMVAFANAVDKAVPGVTKVWGPDWTQQVAVLIPDTQQEMAEVIGGEFELAHIAAVATADYTNSKRRLVRGQRVVVNPANLDQLGRLGREVVLRHEITHIATRAVTAGDTPIWLMEGFADYVGYLETGVALETATQELRAEVRAGRVPEALPVDEDFKGDNPKLSQAYEEAWMACRMIAERIGQDGLVKFYLAAAGRQGAPDQVLEQALRSHLNMTHAQFVEAWRQTLVVELA